MPGLDFLDGASAAPADEPRVDPAETGPARGPDGKFTAATPAITPEAPAEALPEPTPPAPEAKPEPGHVPLSAMLDEREKRQAAERRLAELEANRPTEAAPELDPDTANAMLQLRLNTSEELVRDKEGDETVDAAKAWAIERFKTNPSYQAEVLAKPNPYKFVVGEYKAHLKLQAVSDVDLTDFEAFKAWKAAGGSSPTPPAQPLTSPPVPTPPRSLASMPNAGGTVDTRPQGPGEAFKSIFSG